MQIVPRSLAAVAVLIAGLICTGEVWAETISQKREAAVLKARAGHMNEAVAELRAMLAAGEDDGLVAMDLTTLLQQSRKSREAVAVFEKAAPAEPPDYALLAATRAYRDLHRYDAAARLARQGLKRFPDQTVWPLLLSLVLSDAQRPREALQILQQPEAQRAQRIELLLAEGYSWSRSGNVEKAKAAYAEVLKLVQRDKQDERSASIKMRMSPDA
jgi:biofilm PGA synthesis protein PgaA